MDTRVLCVEDHCQRLIGLDLNQRSDEAEFNVNLLGSYIHEDVVPFEYKVDEAYGAIINFRSKQDISVNTAMQMKRLRALTARLHEAATTFYLVFDQQWKQITLYAMQWLCEAAGISYRNQGIVGIDDIHFEDAYVPGKVKDFLKVRPTEEKMKCGK